MQEVAGRCFEGGAVASAGVIDRAAPLDPSMGVIVLLAGAAGRLAGVRDALGRNLFDLPVAGGRTLLYDWLDRAADLFGGSLPPIRLSIDQGAPEPMLQRGGRIEVRLVRDPESARGTAGVLRDVTRDLGDDEQIFVVQASDLGWAWSESEGRSLLDHGADVVLSADRDLRPAGMMRVRCGLLRRIPSVGFVDLKEQFLPRCAGSIAVIRSDRCRTGTLHSLRSYLAIAADRAAGQEPPGPMSAASAQPFRSGAVCVEAGATVDADAAVLDSVVLSGARVGRGAVIVRSLIGPNVVIPPGTQIVDRAVAVRRPGDRRLVDVVW